MFHSQWWHHTIISKDTANNTKTFLASCVVEDGLACTLEGVSAFLLANEIRALLLLTVIYKLHRFWKDMSMVTIPCDSNCYWNFVCSYICMFFFVSYIKSSKILCKVRIMKIKGYNFSKVLYSVCIKENKSFG